MHVFRRTPILGALSCSLLAGLVVAPPARAQEDTRAHSLAPRAWAIQFRIANDFQLSSFNGSILSIKRHSSARSAVRLGVSGALDLTDIEEISERADTSLAFGIDRDQISAGVELQFMTYPRPIQSVNLFLAAGPFARWANQKVHFEFDGERRTETDWAGGVLGSLGAEWFAARWLGLHAEYGLAVERSGRTSKVTSENPLRAGRRVHHTSWRLRGDGVRFGASAYF